MINIRRARPGRALLPLPANVDLSIYKVVDVSAEPYDNNTGQSLRRGTPKS